jgi:hypothetical protein
MRKGGWRGWGGGGLTTPNSPSNPLISIPFFCGTDQPNQQTGEPRQQQLIFSPVIQKMNNTSNATQIQWEEEYCDAECIGNIWAFWIHGILVPLVAIPGIAGRLTTHVQ